MDSDLNFNSHIKTFKKSVYDHLKNISRNRGFMSQRDLFSIYFQQVFGNQHKYCWFIKHWMVKYIQDTFLFSTYMYATNSQKTATLSSFKSQLKTCCFQLNQHFWVNILNCIVTFYSPVFVCLSFIHIQMSFFFFFLLSYPFLINFMFYLKHTEFPYCWNVLMLLWS